MELYNSIIKIIDANLIYCLIPIILTLMLVELFFKNRFETKKVLNLIRWSIIVYTIITWIYLLIGNILYPEEFTFFERGVGSYKWIMFLSTLFLPFTLFIKKIASKFLYVLFVAFFMKLVFYMARFVIFVPNFLRECSAENGNFDFINSCLYIMLLLIVQGIIIAILALGIFEIIKRRKKVHNSHM